jgi:hypothetical protein
MNNLFKRPKILLYNLTSGLVRYKARLLNHQFKKNPAMLSLIQRKKTTMRSTPMMMMTIMLGQRLHREQRRSRTHYPPFRETGVVVRTRTNDTARGRIVEAAIVMTMMILMVQCGQCAYGKVKTKAGGLKLHVPLLVEFEDTFS